MPAPPAAHLDHGLRHHLHVLDRELAPHAVVVESLGPAVGDDVEAGDVAARRAAVPVALGPVLGLCSRGPRYRCCDDPPAGPRSPSANTLVLTIHLVAIGASSRWARWVGLTGSARRAPGRARPRHRARRHLSRRPPRRRHARRDRGPTWERRCSTCASRWWTWRPPAARPPPRRSPRSPRPSTGAGECVGEFQSLVDPGCAVPPLISLLTGITDDMVVGAPPVSSVLPSLLEFVRGTVDRRPQRLVRPVLPRRRPRRRRLRASREHHRRHPGPGAPARATRRPQLQAPHPRHRAAPGAPALAPGPRRRAGHRRPAAPASSSAPPATASSSSATSSTWWRHPPRRPAPVSEVG